MTTKHWVYRLIRARASRGDRAALYWILEFHRRRVAADRLWTTWETPSRWRGADAIAKMREAVEEAWPGVEVEWVPMVKEGSA